MNSYLLLIAASCGPAAAAILLTLPLWRLRRLRNQTIHVIGLILLLAALIACLIPAFTADDLATGFLCIALSSINIFLFRHYERLLKLIRCPYCRRNALHMHACHNGHFTLFCRHCGLYSEWYR